ncbi:hypothetical protein N7486_003852 [Penicillium sp. IBT 16267x]|nr:hypothetical protein N7486_003852 [Penicillium sp. IBT 16267x]
MGKTTERWFTLRDGLRLYEKTWERSQPDSPPRAHIVLLHGFSDRADLYDVWCSIFTSSYHIQVTAFDRRGWGKSVHHPSQRGLTGPNAQILADLDEYLQHIASIDTAEGTKCPVFLMGHSMGGQEALYYMLQTSHSLRDRIKSIAGLILEAPYIALAEGNEPNPWTVFFGQFLAMFFPWMPMNNKPSPTLVTRDPEVGRAWAADVLCHGTGTLGGLRDMLVREARLTSLADLSKPVPKSLATTLPCPVLWTHGTDDKVCSYAVSKKLFNRLDACDSNVESKIFKSYEGCYHQLHTEPGGMKEQYAQDVGDWVLKIIEEPQRNGVEEGSNKQ